MYNKKKPPIKFIGAAMASLGAIGRSVNGQSMMGAGMQAAGLNQQIQNGFSGGGVTGALEAVKAAQGMGTGNPLSGTGGPADSSNPFGGQKFQITPVQMTYETPSPANMQGSADPLFNESVTNAGNMMFGDVSQRQRSLQNQAGVIQAPVYFKDQTGDNKITKADVVKARTEGYKE
jgi:hypothetical protein